MINRELIRIKVVQLTYAYYQNANRDLLEEQQRLIDSKTQAMQLRGRSLQETLDSVGLTDEERRRLLVGSISRVEDELLKSLEKAYELYHVLLSFIVAVHEEMVHRHDVAAIIALREGHPRPSTRFVDNRFAAQLAANEELRAYIAHHDPEWKEHIDVVRRVCQQIEQSPVYLEYLDGEDEGYDSDRELWRRIYKTIIQDNDYIDDMLEEKSIYWNDDKPIVDDFVLKTIRRFREKNGGRQPLLPAWHDDADRQFALRLLRASLQNADQYHGYMREMSEHWDFERLAYMDVIIMQTALAEMTTFPEIPVNVSINEYVELSKVYSTSKSSTYINAMLDAIAGKLIDNGTLMKTINN